ncbi:mitochondrial inner-membrane-bound regulator-domain-containing protein [Annulohypoxylon maeteangense]|uniref:mitochondrial inner-membrane-bound regulator-domain-containing protein n=1 Tax=Annulohypoxylon maeteangense TaxID=1927788 RepID=UPI002007556E|nr:mitochondrial inner-membrane-bound regulator-domain-containing protein [Annulohypoxylon maeteangense]KAI0886096.1 mitochondrial inner-membrane-bound regulator-domain-containing protein [Annulohypoxylon maeteangense]
MIASSVYGGSICLRCRLRLLRQYTHPSQVSSRTFRLHSTFRPFSTESSAPIDHDLLPEVNSEASSSKDRPQYRDHGDGKKRGGVKRLALLKPKRRLSRNRILTEDAQSIDSDMLGKPASVIIMRDGGIYRRKNIPIHSNDAEGELNNRNTDIEALLDSQRTPLVAEEVRKNIHSLKPKTETVLSEREFRKLQALLIGGFLNTQLSDYLDHHRRPVPFESKSDVKSTIGRGDWIKHITPWAPLGSQSIIPEEIDPSLYGYISDSATPKEKLAVRIMRECWYLSIGELDTGLGETRVIVQSSEFLLLMRGTQRWMSVMGQICLDPGEKIEAFRDQKMLRFVTSKPKVAILVKELYDTIKQITSKTFAMSLVARKPIHEAYLEEVGRITNTHVRRKQNPNQLQVTWIELKTRAAQGLTRLENLSEVVFRLLFTTFTPQPGTTTNLYVTGLDDKAAGRFVADAVSREKLGWKDRMGQWARYMLPLASEGNRLAMKSTLKRLTLPVEPHAEASVFDEHKEFLPNTQFPSHPIKWAESYQVSTKAGFGYLLHENDPLTSPPPLLDLPTTNHLRAFAPVSPHPLHLARLEAKNDEAAHALIQTKSVVVVHFWPERTSKAKREHSTLLAPRLELHLAILGYEVKGIKSLHAIKQTHITDVMLPASPVDIRFMQEQYCELQGDATEFAAWQPLADFLKPARLDLARGKFDMPPRQKFPIPKRLFSSSDANIRSIDGDPSTDPNELISTPYMFAGLEIRRSVSMPYEGFQLTYASVDAEQAGGHKTEVSLEPGFGDGTLVSEIDTSKLHDDFLATCERFARTDSLWSGNLATRRDL